MIVKTLAALLALAVAVAAPANAKKHDHEEGDFTEQICMQLDSGQSLEQIAAGITAGDARYQSPVSTRKVWNTVVLDGACG